MLDRSAPRALRALAPALVLWVVADLLLTRHTAWSDSKASAFTYAGFVILCGGIAAARGRGRTAERVPWTLVGTGLVAWGLGHIHSTVAHWDLAQVPSPSWSDAGYLLLPPFVAAGLLTLVRARGHRIGASRRADAAIAALAIASVGAALVMPSIRDTLAGHRIEKLTYGAYPLTDLMLLGVCVAALAARGWTLDRSWMLIGLGVLLVYSADSSSIVATAHGDNSDEAWYTAGWSGGAALIALGAWQPVRDAPADHQGLRLLVMPVAFGLIALTTLVLVSLTDEWEPFGTTLATLALLGVFARLVLAFLETHEVLRGAQEDAVTDALTGLANRRALTAALDEAVAGPAPTVLALFDLDGFKGYNDAFGHPAGDALLVRLGAALQEAVGPGGRAFRMGGDEFCVLLPAGVDGGVQAVARARAALCEHGEGFQVGCSHGVAMVPGEAGDPSSAIRLADHRLYAEKRVDRASAGRQCRDALLQAIVEHKPALHGHSRDVAVLAEATARRLGLDDAQLEEVRQAAELHDVGKVAIPDEILDKRGPLDETEWAFMRRHTLIGERIIAAAPALSGVGRLVRSSHERWDGGGYPDRLAGTDIPRGSRIIAVADAFDAMTVDRPYRAAMSVHAALEELSRCAGSQFDPEVVFHFRAAVRNVESANAPTDCVTPPGAPKTGA